VARIRHDDIDSLVVADILKEAGLTHGGFYRHFDSREHLVAEAAQRALAKGANRRWRLADLVSMAHSALIDGYRPWHRNNPESGCGVAGLVAHDARADGLPRASFTRQAQVCLSVLTDLVDNADREVGEREAVLALSALVGAISMARAVDDLELSQQIMTDTKAALKERMLN